MRIGNDIVDLTVTENQGRWRDERLLGKLLTPKERESIDSDSTLWTYFAAKEAAYKARRKAEAVAFEPRRMEVDFDRGVLHWDDFPIALMRNTAPPHWVACVAVWAEGRAPVRHWVLPVDAPVLGELTRREASGLVVAASRAMRLFAKSRVARLGFSYDEIEILRPEGGAPSVFVRGKLVPEIELSFSHDGRYFAVAMAAPFLSFSQSTTASGSRNKEMSCE